MPNHNKPAELNRDVMYEARDVKPGVIALAGIAVIVSAFLIHGAVKLTYRYASATQFRPAPVSLVKSAPSPSRLPQLQVNPTAELQQMQETQKQALESYGWIDREKGIVRIPIDEAMRLLVERGLPPAEKPLPSPVTPKSAGQR